MKNLKSAYLSLNSNNLNEQDWFHMSCFFRSDPRFFEAAILKFSEDYSKLNTVKLNLLFQKSKQPSLLGLTADLAGLINKSKQFKTFKKMLCVEIKKSSLQIFYINIHPLKPSFLVELILKSNSVFKKWGFAEVDLPINKSFLLKNYTSVKKNIRIEILEKFLKDKKRIRSADYIQQLQSKGYLVSRRVAELDLKGAPQLKAVDNTKGRYYKVSVSGSK